MRHPVPTAWSEAAEPGQCSSRSDWLIDMPRRTGGVGTDPCLAEVLDRGDFWNVGKTLSLGQNVSSQRGGQILVFTMILELVAFSVWAVTFSDGFLISSSIGWR